MEAQVWKPWGRAYQCFWNQIQEVGDQNEQTYMLSLHIPCMHSVAATQMSIGRGLKRTVDMFRAPREMVEENDRRNELIGFDDTESSSSAE